MLQVLYLCVYKSYLGIKVTFIYWLGVSKILEVRRKMGWYKWRHHILGPYVPTPEEELEHLKYVKAELELRLKYVNDRIAELEKVLAEKKP